MRTKDGHGQDNIKPHGQRSCSPTDSGPLQTRHSKQLSARSGDSDDPCFAPRFRPPLLMSPLLLLTRYSSNLISANTRREVPLSAPRSSAGGAVCPRQLPGGAALVLALWSLTTWSCACSGYSLAARGLYSRDSLLLPSWPSLFFFLPLMTAAGLGPTKKQAFAFAGSAPQALVPTGQTSFPSKRYLKGL